MNNSGFGFKDGDLEIIIQTLSSFPDIEKASIFGSRAKGNFKKGSDVDLVIWTTNINQTWELNEVLNNDVTLPYKFDVLDYRKINNQDLKDHINRAGIGIYKP